MITFKIKKNGYGACSSHGIIRKGFTWDIRHRKDGNYYDKISIFDRYAINGSDVSFIRIMSANGCKADGDIV